MRRKTAFRCITLALAASVCLTGCGNTEKVDGLISSTDAASQNDLDKAVAENAEDVAAQYWADKEATSVPEQVDLDSVDKSNGDIDIDLTKMDPNLVYAQVFEMVNSPDKFIGQKVKADGTFAHTVDHGDDFYAVFIADASACCQQGLEFVRSGDFSFPDDYPEVDSPITVVGTFNTYEDGGYTYCQLKDAEMTLGGS